MSERGLLNKFLYAVLLLYIVLLGLGTLGELFKIEWILQLPLFKI
jgi:hypothetical protein